MEGRKTKGRPRQIWEDYVKIGVTEVGGSGERGREVRGRGDGSETGSAKEGEENKKSTTNIDACFAPDCRDKKESNKWRFVCKQNATVRTRCLQIG